MCTQARSATDATEMPLLKLGPCDYFGEMALMLDEPRAANCIADGGEVSDGGSIALITCGVRDLFDEVVP